VGKQWLLIVANFMDKSFDVLNPCNNTESYKNDNNSVVNNFKKLFNIAYPHCPNFKIAQFNVRYVSVPKQNFK
jgi:hypothetical protein